MRPIRGFSLLNLLIGMVISSVGILAMLSLYKGMTEHSVLSLNDAKQDGQQTLGMLTVQMELQRAGFGIESPIIFDKDETTNKLDFLILKNAKLEEASDGDTSYKSIKTENEHNILVRSDEIKTNSPLTQFAIIWRYRDLEASKDRCASLMAQSYGLTLLNPINEPDGTPYPCSSAADFQSIKWAAAELISESEEDNRLSTYKSENPETPDPSKNKTKLIFSNELNNELKLKCWPFGNTNTTEVKETVHFSIEVKSSFSIDGRGIQKGYGQYMQRFDICLPNFQDAKIGQPLSGT